jgi:Sel1 repeat
MLIPLGFIAALAGFLALPRIQSNAVLAASFAGAAGVLAFWFLILWRRSWGRRKQRLRIATSLRPQHYLQAIAHTSIFVYWGLYWPPIQDAVPLIAAQIVFAYAFDALLSWTRRREYTLGFGPFPIIYSTNLFLRFRDDWFYWQFVLVAVGLLAKELIRWNRDGRQVHIFNPSSFPLALFSLVLILTGASRVTWAEEIATLLILPPQIYLFIFLVALPGQFLFGVASMTLPAVLTTYAFSETYFRLTGTYFFVDSHVPIAVFLGMHLLFTDPSTSPRSEVGRILFGVTYGATVVVLYWLLGLVGAPTYYDKLLQVPLMNLLVPYYDRLGAWLRRAAPPSGAPSAGRRLAYASAWVAGFVLMTGAEGLGHYHPGQRTMFWQSACGAGNPKACQVMTGISERDCAAGSAWSCNELGLRLQATELRRELFQTACLGGIPAGCENRGSLDRGQSATAHGDPRLADYLIVLRAGRGDITEQSPLEVFTRACSEGFAAGCGSVGDLHFQGDTVAKDRALGAKWWERACASGHAVSCANLGVMHRNGDGVAADASKALGYMRRACDLGLKPACELVQAAP